ncbi:hypothetical protein [Halocatena halophila]
MAEQEFAIASADATITCHEASPEKTVFVESNNQDGWIATDLVVDLER